MRRQFFRLAKGFWLFLLFCVLNPLVAHAVPTACSHARFNEAADLGDSGKKKDCTGMPVWWVSEPYENLWIADEPLSYYTSSGQKMAFRWTYQQRGQLSGNLRRREQAGSAFALTRYRHAFDYMTNASWSHNWWSEIVFWSPSKEGNSWLPTSTGDEDTDRSYYAMPNDYEAIAFLGDGGTINFNAGSASTPNGQQKARFEIIGGSPGAGPEIPNPFYKPQWPYPQAGIVWVDNPMYGFRMHLPDGSQLEYGFVTLTKLDCLTLADNRGMPGGIGAAPCIFGTNNGASYTARAYLTRHIDPQGRITQIAYERTTSTPGPAGLKATSYVVKYVVDPDGRTNTYNYASYKLASITDPYGRTAQFGYDGSDNLGAIVDAAGLPSYFRYQNDAADQLPHSGWISSLETPYGMTYFKHFEEGEMNTNGMVYLQRAILATEQVEGNQWASHFYLYRHACGDMETTDSPPDLPTVSGINFDDANSAHSGSDHGTYQHRNSYYWGRRQFAAITGIPRSAPELMVNHVLTTLGNRPVEYRKARFKHWLRSSGTDSMVVTGTLSVEREPSPSPAGDIIGAHTFYAYPGQDQAKTAYEGTDTAVSCIARKLPDGTSQYEKFTYNGLGYPMAHLESYTKANGDLGERLSGFGYHPNGIDIQFITNGNARIVSLGYNDYHQPVKVTNALGQFSVRTYQTGPGSLPNQLNTREAIGGATADVDYYGATSPVDAKDRRFISKITRQPNGSVWQFKYDRGMVTNAYNDLGLSMHYFWDDLLRSTEVHFPDGSYVSNWYDKLDLAGTQDRVGGQTTFTYDKLRHLRTVTDALGRTTIYNRCSCGALDNIVDALGYTTSFKYDNQSRLTRIDYPDKASVTYTYDRIGRVTEIMDGANRSLSFTYNNQNLITNVNNLYGRVARYAYDERDRLVEMTDAMGVTVTNYYDALSRLTARAWSDNARKEYYLFETNGLYGYSNRNGALTLYSRDQAGRLATMTNANGAVTTYGYDSADQLTSLVDGLNKPLIWEYDIYGHVKKKIEKPGGSARDVLQYSYDAKGRLTNRWALATGNTGYTYDPVDNLTNITYGLPSPDVVQEYVYDPLHRLTKMVDVTGSTDFAYEYTTTGRTVAENGPWIDDKLTLAYKHGLRDTAKLLQPSGAASFDLTYGYDQAWRLETLDGPSGHFQYDYKVANVVSPASVVRQLTLPNEVQEVNTFDDLGRLETSNLKRYNQTMDGVDYTYDLIGQRTNILRNLGLTTSIVQPTYDKIGQLTAWKAKEAGGTARLNEKITYGYDAAGNLNKRTNNTSELTFNVNDLNELTTVTRPNTAFTYSGSTPTPGTSVSVNSVSGSYYADGTFAVPGLTLANGSNPFNVSVAGTASRTGSTSATVDLPTTVSFTYDNNGNLTGDGLRTFVYDWENQLTNVTVTGQWRVDFYYDGLGRKRKMLEYGWVSPNWSLTNEVHYIYDGMLVMQERDGSNVPKVTYTRGRDLSGSLQGAGGIGGLLARKDADGSQYYHADGAGNITLLLDGNRNLVARYLYDPFGNLVGKWGSKADVNRYQFSSKELHARSGLYYYGYRFYEPNLQRWMNRDPLGEAGSLNLFGFVGNGVPNFVDPDGLKTLKEHAREIAQGIYHAMMGEGGPRSMDNYSAMRNDMLGEMDRDDNFIRDMAGDAGELVEELGEEAAKQYAGGKAAAMAGAGVVKVIECGRKAYLAAKAAKAAKAIEEALRARQLAHGLTQSEASALRKINNILSNNLKPGPKGDISGAIHDMVGNPIPKPGGGTYDHIEDLGSMLRGLRTNADKLANSTDAALVTARQQALTAIQQIEEAIKGAGL